MKTLKVNGIELNRGKCQEILNIAIGYGLVNELRNEGHEIDTDNLNDCTNVISQMIDIMEDSALNGSLIKIGDDMYRYDFENDKFKQFDTDKTAKHLLYLFV